MLWFRDQGWHWAGALVAALAFCYGASMAWRIQHIGQVLSLAYLPIAMLCLDRALARRSIVYGAAAGVAAACIVLGRDQVALLVVYLLDRRSSPGASSSTEPAGRRRARQPRCRCRRARRRCLRCHRRARAADRAAGRRIQPALHRLHRRRPRLAASGPAAHARRAGGVRRLGPHGGLLGPAELRLAGHRHLPRPEHGPALHRRHPAAPADPGGAARPACGRARSASSPSPPASRCSTRSAGTRRSSACFYELLPGVSLYRRPADATFLIGALAAILAGYSTHRLFSEPLAELNAPAGADRARRRSPARSRSPSASRCGSAACRLLALPLGIGRALLRRRRWRARGWRAAHPARSRCWRRRHHRRVH